MRRKTRIGYKLFKLRKDGTIGPLFINCVQRIPVGKWVEAEYHHHKKRFAYRPGWHVAPEPNAPHLGLAGRVWKRVEIADYEELPRPKAQGGKWWIARWMRVLPEEQ